MFGSVCHFAGTFHASELSPVPAGDAIAVVAVLDSIGGWPGGSAVDVIVVNGGSLAIAAAGPMDPELPSCIDRPAANAAAPMMAAMMPTVDVLNRLAWFIGDG